LFSAVLHKVSDHTLRMRLGKHLPPETATNFTRNLYKYFQQWTSNSKLFHETEGGEGRHDRYFKSRTVPTGQSIFTFISLFSSEYLTVWIKQWIPWYMLPPLTAQRYQS